MKNHDYDIPKDNDNDITLCPDNGINTTVEHLRYVIISYLRTTLWPLDTSSSQVRLPNYNQDDVLEEMCQSYAKIC